MFTRTYDIVIVGGGHAGSRVAEGVRSVSKDLSVLIIGEEPYPPYERPPLSKAALVGSAPWKTARHDPAYYADHRIDLRLGEPVVHLDCASSQVRLAGNDAVAYRRLVLATGSRPRRIEPGPNSSRRLFYLRTLTDAKNLAPRLAPGARIGIIGAGFIGLEVAASACERGCKVSVFDLQPRALSRVLPPTISVAVERFHRQRGVEFLLGRETRIDPRSDHHVVVSAGGEERQFDTVVVGVGVMPNTELAKDARIETRDGILVDEYGSTSRAGVYAAGEVTQHPVATSAANVRRESWQVAENQAFAAGRSAAGEPSAVREVPWFWSDQSTLNLQVLGAIDRSSDLIFRGDPSSGSFSAFVLNGGVVTGAVAINAGRDIGAARRLIASAKPVTAELLRDPDLGWNRILNS